MTSQIQLGDINIDVVKKDIKNVHLRVYPPTGRVRISAPKRMSLDNIRVFATSKLDWIKRQRTKLREQARESQRDYLHGESHYVWGQRVLLALEEADGVPNVELRPSKLVVRVHPGADKKMREAVVSRWYRELLRDAVPPLIETWEARLGVTVTKFYVRQMKTLWGSCNPRARTIRLNTELAKKPKVCLEYIVMHEMAHLLEASHGAKFRALMDKHLPAWRETRRELNRLPVGHAEWAY